MPYETWFAFAAASAVLLAVPGPSMLLVISYALGHGRKTAFATVTGVVLGNLAAMAVVFTGLGLLLWASPSAFATLKWIGAAYLVFIAIRIWRAPVGDGPVADNDNLPEEKPLKVIAHCFKVTALTPKSMVFFVAFLPQFIAPGAPFLQQVAALVAIFIALSITSAVSYAMLADRARKYIRKHSVRRVINRSSGTLLISAGAVTAGYRKIAA